MKFLTELKKRNRLLFWFGLFNMAAGLVSLALTQADDTTILGISAWIKPMKFYFSIWIMSWTMGWLLHHLHQEKKVIIFSVVVIATMVIEMIAITTQSARGTTSHFNTRSDFDQALFNIMGVAIMIFTLWTAYMCFLFFKKRNFDIPPHFVWSIRLGILFFVIFSIEGGAMVGLMKHTIGADDGGEGLPILNWSREYGDLRIAHFFGMHSLQLLPLVGYYLANSRKQVFLFAGLYFIMVSVFLVQALYGIPLF